MFLPSVSQADFQGWTFLQLVSSAELFDIFLFPSMPLRSKPSVTYYEIRRHYQMV